MNIVRLAKEIYRNELRGEEREKVITRYLIIPNNRDRQKMLNGN